jgi:hypothetical protein
MRLAFALLIFVTLFAWRGIAQNFDQYKTLVPVGPVPRDFTEKSFVKVASEVKNISRSPHRKTKSAFYLESTFGVDDFLSGGSVLFNDPASLYLQSVLNTVIRPFPHLQNRIRIYAVKSAVVNAFTTNNGIIFVNLGLLARLENEAQLAFVIAHEIVHFEKQHVLNAYIYGVDIDRGNGGYRNLPHEGRSFAKSSYSKELETEADWLGSDIFLRSGYSRDSVEGVFDILRYADIPVPLRKFEKRIFESGKYIFHDSLVSAKPVDQKPEEDYDDSRSTHPNIRKRKETVGKKLGGQSSGASYLVSRKEFVNIRKIARFELIRIHLLDHQFLHALNLSLDVLPEHPSSRYVRESIGKSLYGIAKRRMSEDFEVSLEEWQGESFRLASFISALSDFEVGVLAMRELFKCMQAAPSPGIERMLRDLMTSLEKENHLAGRFARPGFPVAAEPSEHGYTQFAFVSISNAGSFFRCLTGN